MIFELKNITKNYRQGESNIEVLKGLDFQLTKGETVSIVGQSGSGKSTLLSIMSGLENIDAGEIMFQGKEISTLSPDNMTDLRARNLGIVFQHFHLVPHLTALENILLPLDILGINDSKLGREMLERVGLGHREKHFPSQLSGGEMQRVAVARALVAKPMVLLADEPSGNLDAENAKGVIDLMFNLVREENTSLILVSHDLTISSLCSRQLKLQGGQLI